MPDTKFLQEIVELVTRLVAARYGALGVLNERKDAIEHFITAGIDERTRSAIGSPPEGKGILGILIRDPKPLRLRDLQLDPRSIGFPPGHPTMRSFLGIPLFSREGTYGSFYFTEKGGGSEFSAADERLAENFARLAVRAIEFPAAIEGIRRDLAVFRDAEDESQAIVITNPAREIILWNDGAGKLFGYTQEEALGRRYEDLLVPDAQRAEWRRCYTHEHVRDLRAGKTIDFEASQCRKKDGEVAVNVSMAPIQYGAAGIMAVTVVFRIMPKYVLKLFVAGQTIHSRRAIESLRQLCRRQMKGEYDLQIIDVMERPQLAEDEKILATPTLIKELPFPLRRVVGDLTDVEKMLIGLDLQYNVSPEEENRREGDGEEVQIEQRGDGTRD